MNNTMITLFIALVIATVLVSSTGLALVGVLQMPGNMLDWLPSKIEKIKNPYLRDLFSCTKCVSGQCALWSYVAVVAYSDAFHWFFSPLCGILWICWIIVVTDQAGKRLGYS